MLPHFRLKSRSFLFSSIKLFILFGIISLGNLLKAQEYCGYPEVYKVSTVTLDTQIGGGHFICDVVQNQKGVWTLGMFRNQAPSSMLNSILLTRFDDTGKFEWNLKLNVLQNASITPKMVSSDDQGIVIVGSRIDTVSKLSIPWIASISPSGSLRWTRELDPIAGIGIQGSAFFNNVEVKNNGEIWAVGTVAGNLVYFPFILRLNRFGNTLDCRIYTESNQSLPFITRWHEYRDIIPWGNSMMVGGVYRELFNTVPVTNSLYQPMITLFDSAGKFVKNTFFKTDSTAYSYEIRELVRSTTYPNRVFLLGSMKNTKGNNKNLMWVACADTDGDSLIWQNTYDTLESSPQRGYFDRDKLIVLYAAERVDGLVANGILQIDSSGKWEFVHHVSAGNITSVPLGFQGYFHQTRNSFPLRDGGLVCAGNNWLNDTANVQMTWTKPCEPSFCANISYAVKTSKPTLLTPRLTKGHTVVNATVSAISPTQEQVPGSYQSVTCRLCPMPEINVSDVILCDFPLFHQQDVWDIYSEVTWFDGDNSKYKTFDKVGKYWLTKQNACGTVSDTFRIFKENRPVKVLNDNEYFCTGRLLTLKAKQPNPGNFTYQWSTGATGFELGVTEGKTYTLVTTSNGCGSRTDVVNVYESNCDCQICVPNNMTPYNADGINDEWLPRTDCKYLNCTVKEGHYKIFNRWGEKIVENPIKVAWNGKDSKGDFVQRGVYVYEIKIILDENVEGNRIINESGTITLW